MSISQGMFSELASHGLDDVAGSDMAEVTLTLASYVDVLHEATKLNLEAVG